jgi:hypothetical protein
MQYINLEPNISFQFVTSDVYPGDDTDDSLNLIIQTFKPVLLRQFRLTWGQ